MSATMAPPVAPCWDDYEARELEPQQGFPHRLAAYAELGGQGHLGRQEVPRLRYPEKISLLISAEMSSKALLGLRGLNCKSRLFAAGGSFAVLPASLSMFTTPPFRI